MIRYLYSGCTVVLLSYLLGGCAIPPNQGKLVRSFEVGQLIEAGTVLPEHTYYYTGPEAEPDAIIAIDNRYTLQSKYWLAVENVEDRLAEWNGYIDNPSRYRKMYTGARIMTPDGQVAGIWYSRYTHTVVRYPDPSTIIVFTPYVPLENERPFSLGPAH